MDVESAERKCSICGFTVLNSYNAGGVCGLCRTPISPTSPKTTPKWGDSDELRRALSKADMPRVMGVLRKMAGDSQHGFARRIAWTQGAISKAENGVSRGFFDIGAILAVFDRLEIPREVLLPLVLGDPYATLGEEAQSPLSESEPEEAGMDLSRRHFLGATALVAALPPERVDRTHIDDLEARTRDLRERDNITGGGALLPEALPLYTRARTMVDGSDYSEKDGRRLLAATADLGAVTGWLAYDSGRQELARQLYLDAKLLSESCGDPQLIAYTNAVLAQQSSQLARLKENRGLAREALRFSQQAEHAARLLLPSPRLHAVLLSRKALAHALLQDEAGYNSAIGQARDMIHRGPSENDTPWTAYATPSEVSGMAAIGLTRLGKPARSVELYQEAVQDPQRAPRDRLYYQARLAVALHSTGDLSSGLKYAQLTLDGLEQQTASLRILNELKPLLGESHSPTQRQFAEHWRAVRRTLATKQTTV